MKINKKVTKLAMQEKIIVRTDNHLKEFVKNKSNQYDITISEYIKTLIAYDMINDIYYKSSRQE